MRSYVTRLVDCVRKSDVPSRRFATRDAPRPWPRARAIRVPWETAKRRELKVLCDAREGPVYVRDGHKHVKRVKRDEARSAAPEHET
jgi:hypothetical protein